MKQHAMGTQGTSVHPQKVKDPVCGMDVSPETAAGKLEHDGRTYHFCSAQCMEKFRKEPARFAATEKAGVRL